MSKKLREQFEKEKHEEAGYMCISGFMPNQNYLNWLEEKAGQHETIVKYPKHNSTEMINYLLVTALRSLDKEKRHVLTKNLVERDVLWED